MKLQLIAMLSCAPVVLLQAPLSALQELFDRPETLVMVHNPELTKGLRNRTTITVVVFEMLAMSWERLFCASCPILISGFDAPWNLGSVSESDKNFYLSVLRAAKQVQSAA